MTKVDIRYVVSMHRDYARNQIVKAMTSLRPEDAEARKSLEDSLAHLEAMRRVLREPETPKLNVTKRLRRLERYAKLAPINDELRTIAKNMYAKFLAEAVEQGADLGPWEARIAAIRAQLDG